MCASCRYEEVSRGRTGHAEAVQVTFDANTVSLVQLLDVFFEIHDPTTLDSQGACARRA
jgi:peptide-methionine (S)-S-oxide reductase